MVLIGTDGGVDYLLDSSERINPVQVGFLSATLSKIFELSSLFNMFFIKRMLIIKFSRLCRELHYTLVVRKGGTFVHHQRRQNVWKNTSVRP